MFHFRHTDGGKHRQLPGPVQQEREPPGWPPCRSLGLQLLDTFRKVTAVLQRHGTTASHLQSSLLTPDCHPRNTCSCYVSSFSLRWTVFGGLNFRYFHTRERLPRPFSHVAHGQRSMTSRREGTKMERRRRGPHGRSAPSLLVSLPKSSLERRVKLWISRKS